MNGVLEWGLWTFGFLGLLCLGYALWHWRERARSVTWESRRKRFHPPLPQSQVAPSPHSSSSLRGAVVPEAMGKIGFQSGSRSKP